MSDEESKFSFSERTRVDEGDSSEASPETDEELAEGLQDTAQDEGDGLIEVEDDDENDGGDEGDDSSEKTGMLSAVELEEAGILDLVGDDADATDPEAEGPDVAGDSQAFGARTMMLDTSEPTEGEEEATEAEISAVIIEAAPEPFQMLVVVGRQEGESFPIDAAKVVVGRSAESDITLLDSSVSRKHFELHRTPDGFMLRDLGSGNGTLIDGDKVDEIPMVHGMIVEVGMTRLQWSDPALVASQPLESPPPVGDVDEDKTQVIDLASIQLDPSFATKAPPRPATEDRPVIRSVERARSVTDRAAVPQISTRRSPTQDVSRAAKWAGVAVVGILAIVGASSLFGLMDPPPDSPPPSDAAGVQDPEAQMAKGLEAFTGWRWAEARVHFEAARGAHPDKAKVDGALARVGQEEAAAAVMEHVRAALEASRFKDVINKLEEIPDSSVYYGDAKILIGEATEGLVSAHLEIARRLSSEGKRRLAIIELEAALQLLPGDAEAQALLRNLQDASVAVATPRRPTRRASRPPRDGRTRGTTRRSPDRKRGGSEFEIEPDWPEDSGEGPGAAKLEIGPGLDQYGAGNFDDAISLLSRVMRNTDSDRQRDKAKRLVADIRAFKSLWRTANDNAASERTGDAIASLKRAKALDRAISGAYRRRIDRVLATQYATQANSSMLSGKLAKAGSLARKSLALNPSQAVARSVMDEVRSKADGWLSRARSPLSRNPDKAKTLLTQVLTVSPKRDARYIEAYGLLKQIDSSDED